MVADENQIINRVQESGIITLDLENFLPELKSISTFDLKDYLFKGLILQEKPFREVLKTYDWSQFESKNVGIFCSADAIIPKWAYMLVASKLSGIANTVVMGDEKVIKEEVLNNTIEKLNVEEFRNERVIIKGCSEDEISSASYLKITNRLRPVVKSIMYGEACSNVPIFKNKAS